MNSTKVTVPKILEMKKKGEKIAALTAYDYLLASLLDQAGLDIILVGDSVGMVFAGYATTIPVTMEEILYHTKAVARGVKQALTVTDMPFLSFQVSAEKALENAGRCLKEGGVEAVKLEGGREIAETIRTIVKAGIPVMGHLGLTPQSINRFGGYAVRATTEEEAIELVEDAQALEDAGVFAIVLEKIPAQLAKKVTEKVKVPTIGIGAGKYCDGQVLVTHDMLGIFEKFIPKFVRRYAELAKEIRQACSQYTKDVKTGNFPSEKESY